MATPGDSPALDEFSLIRRFFTFDDGLQGAAREALQLGVGDDCALLALPPGSELAISVDTQLPDVHFPADALPADIASRALRCAASDLAAMGATPLGFTLALSLPSVDVAWLVAFSDGLRRAATELGCPLIGGDTTRGPLTLSVQVHGAVPAGQALRRSGAQVGDDVWVSGSLGDGAAALAQLQHRTPFSAEHVAYLHQRFYSPEVDFALAEALRGVATAAIDISDGLLADLAHLCRASAVAACLDAACLPLSAPLQLLPFAQAMRWALTGGDDYRLCFTAPACHREDLSDRQGLARIGTILPADDAQPLIRVAGFDEDVPAGFRHF